MPSMPGGIPSMPAVSMPTGRQVQGDPQYSPRLGGKLEDFLANKDIIKNHYFSIIKMI